MNIVKYHVLLVHFPIALGFCAVLADLLWLVTRKNRFRDAGIYCLILAAILVMDSLLQLKNVRLKRNGKSPNLRMFPAK